MRHEHDERTGFSGNQRADELAGDPAHAPGRIDERCPGVESGPHERHVLTAPATWSVVIPTRHPDRARALAKDLLPALAGDDEVVIVADNVAADELPPDADRRLRVVRHDGERGFATACNHGCGEARGSVLLILNDDVDGVSEIALAQLRAALAWTDVGLAGPNVISVRLGRSESGTTLRWRRGLLDAAQGQLDAEGTAQVPYVCGACIALRRDVFARLRGFDARLAPYFWEDVDLALRARRAGLGTVVLGGVRVAHRHGSTIGSEPESAVRTVYERNRLLVTWRHLPRWRWPEHVAWLVVRLAAGVIRGGVFPAALLAALRRSGRARRARRG